MDPSEQLREHWLLEINSRYHNAENFHKLHLLELSNLELRPPKGVDSYKDQETRATIEAAQLYLSQIRLVETELKKLDALRQGIIKTPPNIKQLADWSKKINKQIEEIEARVEYLWDQRIYTVLRAGPARHRSVVSSEQYVALPGPSEPYSAQ